MLQYVASSSMRWSLLSTQDNIIFYCCHAAAYADVMPGGCRS